LPKKIPNRELSAIQAIIGRHPDGAGIRDIYDRLPAPIPFRTLQRRLARLVARGALQRTGRGRATRYRPAKTLNGTVAGPNRGPAPSEPGLHRHVPLSAAGAGIRKSVRAPLHKRMPTGYNREFLEAYAPNQTFYLPPDIRRRLLRLGQEPGDQRPAGTHARKILSRLLIDLSWNSSRLEGNTYSLLETERLLELGEAARGKNARETQMILNHKAAIELLVEQAEEIGFNRYTILNLHALLSDNLLEDPRACGRLRAGPVTIGGSVYHPLEMPQVIEECFHLCLDKADAVADAFEQSFFIMVHLPYLQPFEDVNKRVARMAANIPFIRGNLSPLSFLDVPEQEYIEGVLGVYELNRVELLRDVFVWAYERSCARYSAVSRSLGEPDPFRLKYRRLITEAVVRIVRGGMDKKAAVSFIKDQASKNMPPEDQPRFIEIIETEMMTLHEGNMARYGLRPSEYRAWTPNWQ
jgi:hypothetical protein